MNHAIDEAYFEWLYHLVGTKNWNPARSYRLLAEQLHKKEFLWFVPNDDNRVVDGQDLRREYIEKFEIEGVDQLWLDLGCSMLEMLIALARRASFEATGTSDEWFWKFIDNLGLRQCADSAYIDSDETWFEVNNTLDRVIERTYDRNGSGGLFPLFASRADQRKIEIWYQLSAYLLEEDRWEVGPRI